MKYLKYFETKNSQITDHLDDIKSILYDLIDEYGIQELPDDLDEDDDSKPGIYYHLVDFYDIAEKTRGRNNQLRRPHIELIFYCIGGWELDSYLGDPNWTKKDAEQSNLKWYKYFDIIEKEVPMIVNRLKSMGYKVKYDTADDAPDRQELKDDSEFFIGIYLD